MREKRLDPYDFDALETFVLGVLRAHPQLTWVSYGDREDRFVGAWRDGAGQLFVNRSFPAGGRIRLEEDRILPDGSRAPLGRDDHGYRPSQRPFFRAAAANRDLTWTEPYEFYASGGPGLTCAMPLFDWSGLVQGVLTVDFSLTRLAEFLDEVEVSPHGRVFLATQQASSWRSRRGGGRRRPPDPRCRCGPRQGAPRPGFHRGVRPRRRELSRPRGVLPGRRPGWRAEVVVPERDYTARVDAQARRALLLGALAVVVALGCGIATARWMARPPGGLARVALRIRAGHLDAVVRPRSHDEIGVLSGAMSEMVRALRDREFVR